MYCLFKRIFFCKCPTLWNISSKLFLNFFLDHHVQEGQDLDNTSIGRLSLCNCCPSIPKRLLPDCRRDEKNIKNFIGDAASWTPILDQFYVRGGRRRSSDLLAIFVRSSWWTRSLKRPFTCKRRRSWEERACRMRSQFTRHWTTYRPSVNPSQTFREEFQSWANGQNMKLYGAWRRLCNSLRF